MGLNGFDRKSLVKLESIERPVHLVSLGLFMEFGNIQENHFLHIYFIIDYVSL